MGMRVKPLDFQRLNLRCHALLSDVPLHDVWAIPLNGGGPGRSIEDARAILFGDCRPPNFVVRGLFALRSALGRVFDGMTSAMIRPADRTSIALLKPIAHSLRLLRRLARARSACSTSWVRKPSASFAMRPCMPFWRSFSRRARGGYTLYLAIYVKPVSLLTTLYMP